MCALSRDGHISGFGFNNTPPKGVFVSISIRPNHSLALTRDGRIIIWGKKLSGLRRLTTDRKHFVAIAGSQHSIGLTRDGYIVGCGIGQTNCPSGNNFVAIAAGENHSLALTLDGRIVGWGSNSYGQINCPPGNNFVAIAAGYSVSLALTRQGRIVQWGASNYKPKGSKFVAIYAYKNYFGALTQNGRIVKWGNGYIKCSKEKYAMPYDYLTRLNSGLKTLCNMPKYIKMEILEDYTGWEFRDLYNL